MTAGREPAGDEGVGPAAPGGAGRAGVEPREAEAAPVEASPDRDPGLIEPVRAATVPVVFFGSGGFGLPALEALLDMPQVELVLVVSTPDRPVGRRAVLGPTPVAARARELGLPLFQPSRLGDAETVATLARSRPRLGVLADYGRLVPDAVLELFPAGILNLHPSLLPRHRGAAPIPAAILAGDAETGVSLIVLVHELDAGPIVAAERLPLRGDEAAPELEARAAEAAAALLRRTLPRWLVGEVAPAQQPAAGVTLTRPLRREDGRLDPRRPAVTLERQVRAFQPWPGSFVETAAGRLVVWRAEAAVRPVSPDDGGGGRVAPPGRLVADGDGLALATADGLLRLLEVQLAGGRRMSAAELRRGRPGLAGSGIGPADGEDAARS